MEDYTRMTIDLLKQAVAGCAPEDELDAAILRLAVAMDKRLVYNQPTEGLEALYGDLLWLKSNAYE